jgi:hypothetical protein
LAVKGQHLHGSKAEIIQQIQFDTRKIYPLPNQAFFALKGAYRNGHDFISDAYKKGVRTFVVSEPKLPELRDATFIFVKDTLLALQDLACYHRQKFTYPIIGITGSVGKTTVKEWLFHILSDKYRIVRSPKSFNSQLGVALSLLNLHEDCDLAIIEAGILVVFLFTLPIHRLHFFIFFMFMILYNVYGHYGDDSGGMAYLQVLVDRTHVRSINGSNSTVQVRLSGRYIEVYQSYGTTLDIQWSILIQKLR